MKYISAHKMPSLQPKLRLYYRSVLLKLILLHDRLLQNIVLFCSGGTSSRYLRNAGT